MPDTQPPLLPDMVEADVLWLSAGAAAPAIEPDCVCVASFRWQDSLQDMVEDLEHHACSESRFESLLLVMRDGSDPITTRKDSMDPADSASIVPTDEALLAASPKEQARLAHRLDFLIAKTVDVLECTGHQSPLNAARRLVVWTRLRDMEPEDLQRLKRQHTVRHAAPDETAWF